MTMGSTSHLTSDVGILSNYSYLNKENHILVAMVIEY